jgi:hypothetical protein
MCLVWKKKTQWKIYGNFDTRYPITGERYIYASKLFLKCKLSWLKMSAWLVKEFLHLSMSNIHAYICIKTFTSFVFFN